jgi:hypothetical protein
MIQVMMIKKILFGVFLFGLPALLFADQLILGNGRIYEGAIVSADDRSVSIQISDTQQVRIPHSLISSVFFRYADRVYLLSGEIIKCKVLDEKLPELYIISENGPRQLKISNLKRYFYSEADSLSLISLPRTGSVFNNQKSINLIHTKIDRAIFISISGGILSVPAKSWNKDFITASTLLGLAVQAQIGLSLQKNLAIYAGYMYGRYKNTAEGDLVAVIRTGYLHLGVSYTHTFDFLSGTDFCISADAGLLNLSGNLYTYSYRNITLDPLSAHIAGRILTGADIPLMKQLIAYLKAGYFFAQKFVVTVPAECSYDISIPLNGWTIIAGFSFYIPI